MATINANVRWADNTDDLKKNILDSVDVIDAMKRSVDRTAASLGGDGLLRAANNTAAAIEQLGGVEKLTSAERERANAILEKAIEKYDALGRAAPTALQQLAAATREPSDAAMELHDKLIAAFENPQQALRGLADGMKAELVEGAGEAAVGVGIASAVVIGFGMAAFEAGEKILQIAENTAKYEGAIQDVSEKTGIAVPELSKLGLAFQVAGSSVEQLSTSMFMLEKNMGETPDKVNSGLQRIGLSLSELKQTSPEEWMPAIGQALRDTEDPVARNAALFEMFGRAGRDLGPTLMKVADAMDLVAGIQPITPEEAKQAEQFEMNTRALTVQFESFERQIGNAVIPSLNNLLNLITRNQWVIKLGFSVFGKVLDPTGMGGQLAHVLGAGLDDLDQMVNGDQIPNAPKAPAASVGAGYTGTTGKDLAVLEKEAIRDLNKELKEQEDARRKAAAAAKEQYVASESVRISTEGYAGVLANVSGSTVEAIRWDLQHGASIDAVAKSYQIEKEYVQQVEKEIKGEAKTAADTAKLKAEAYKVEFEGKKTGIEALLTLSKNATGDETAVIKAGLDQQKKLDDEYYDYVAKKTLTANDYQRMKIEEWRANQLGNFNGSVQQWEAYYERVNEIADAKLQDIEDKEKGFFGRLGDLMKSSLGGVNDVLSSLFSGEGIGRSIQSLATNIGSGLLNMIPVIGPYLSQFAGAIVSGLKRLFGGPSQQELQGRDVESKFQESFGGFQNMMDAIGKAYVATGRTAQQAQADVASLLAAEKQGGDAAKQWLDKINGAFTEQKQDAQDLQAAIQKYGFTIEQLGPAMRKQQLTEQAVGLENDFRLLVGSGIDVNLVLQKMGTSINDFIKLAMKTGTEVPSEMQPILQKMIEMGTLTDANGNKITNLKDSGITFSETMTQGFDRIVNALNKVLTQLGGIPDEMNKIPTSRVINIDVKYNDGGVDSGAMSGMLPGESARRGPGETTTPTAHSGAMVEKGKLLHFHSGGLAPDEVLAVLQTGEGVLRRTAVQALGGPSVIRALNQAGSSANAVPLNRAPTAGRAEQGSTGGHSFTAPVIIQLGNGKLGEVLCDFYETGGKWAAKAARTSHKMAVGQ